ncbi:MAG: cell division protein FtsA [Spirochaetaceae bacterium]|nr:cell division protein FtsA [Spirochaetaceae bacterium]
MAGERMMMGLDIGSGTIRCVIGSIGRDDQFMVDSICERPSGGVLHGSIINIEQAVRSINSVINEAQLLAGTEIEDVVIGVGGESIQGTHSQGVVGISDPEQEIKKEDVIRSMEVAKAFELPPDREVIHLLVQDFKIDGRSGIKDPIDMIGRRLETKVLVVTASSILCQTHRKCVQRLGLNVFRTTLQCLADADVTLSAEEKEIGTILINIGAGTTDMICYSSGTPIYTGGVNLGGNSVTDDIAQILSKPRTIAEQLKIESGHSFVPSVSSEDIITIPSVGGLPAIQLPKKELAKIIEARMAEIFSRLQNELLKAPNLGNMGGGVVLVGGGALLSGVTDLASEIFRVPCRVGFPEALGGLDRNYINPQYTTVLGLLKSNAKKQVDSSSPQKKKKSSKKGNVISKFFKNLF